MQLQISQKMCLSSSPNSTVFTLMIFPPIILFKLFLKTKGTKTEPGMTKADFFQPNTLEPADQTLQETLSTPFPSFCHFLCIFHTFPFQMDDFLLQFVPWMCHFPYTWFLNNSVFGKETTFLPADYATLGFFIWMCFHILVKCHLLHALRDR